jgi:catechol 2,3-dioxygenase-like lactoylglutathione lyase family enzyme
MLKSVSGIIFLVKDLAKSLDFYKELGFGLKSEPSDEYAKVYLNWFWIELLQKDAVITKEFKKDLDKESLGAGAYIHISIDNIDGYFSDLKQKGFDILSEPQNYPWGHREFVIADPDGYKLVFFTKLK